MEKISQGFLKIMMDFCRYSDVFLAPPRKIQSHHRQIIALHGPPSPCKLPMCHEQTREYAHSIPFRVPEINSLVDVNDGNDKGKGSYVAVHHQQQPLWGSQIFLRSAPPVLPDSCTGFLEMLKALCFRAASASACLLTGLCSWDGHMLAVTSTKRLSALLCPALFINIFLSTPHSVSFAT